MFQMITFIIFNILFFHNNNKDYELAPLPGKVNYNLPIKISFVNNTKQEAALCSVSLCSIDKYGEKSELIPNFFQPYYKVQDPDMSYIIFPQHSSVHVTLPSIKSLIDAINKVEYKNTKSKLYISEDETLIIDVFFFEKGVVYSSENWPKHIESTPFRIVKEKME